MSGYAGRPGLRAAWDRGPGHPAPDDSRRGGRRGQQVFYWPLTAPFLLAGLEAVVFLVALLQVGVFSYAFARLGIGPEAALILLVASLAGSAVNLPVARLRNQVVEVRVFITGIIAVLLASLL
jgi:uncharacterized membrane protein